MIISPEEEGERLDKILSNRFNQIKSRTYFQYLIEEKRIRLNGLPVKKRMKPSAGDLVEIEFVLTPELNIQPEPIPLDILFEDDHILAANKPAGMVVHPAVGNWSGTFANALLFHCQNHFAQGDLRPGIVHRLDKETTGVILAAKSPLAHQKLIELFSLRKIYKEYLAICVGNPGHAEINAAIGRHPIHRMQMAVCDQGGKEAITFCKTLHFDGKLSFASLVLATGRTHQIRVHMKHHGTPILGDPVYGSPSSNKKYGALRQMLHARILRFEHPINGNLLELEAPLPQDIKSRLPSNLIL